MTEATKGIIREEDTTETIERGMVGWTTDMSIDMRDAMRTDMVIMVGMVTADTGKIMVMRGDTTDHGLLLKGEEDILVLTLKAEADATGTREIEMVVVIENTTLTTGEKKEEEVTIAPSTAEALHQATPPDDLKQYVALVRGHGLPC